MATHPIALMRRRHLLLASAATSYLGLWGCGQRFAPLTVSAHTWIGYEPLFYARQQGWMADILAKLNEVPDASSSMHALVAGLADCAALTLDEVMRVREAGVDMRVVLVFNVSNGADVVLAKPHVRQPADLIGRTIAVENGALGALMLAECLKALGLGPDQVKVQTVGFDGHLEAWATPQVDALVTYQPVAARLTQAGAQVLFDSSRIPWRIVDVLAVTESALSQRPDDVAALVGLYFRAYEQWRLKPQDASDWLVRRLHMEPNDIALVMQGLERPDLQANRSLLDGPEPRLLPQARSLADFMRDSGLLKRPQDVSDLFTGAALPEQGAAA